jgi:hypothetical protein
LNKKLYLLCIISLVILKTIEAAPSDDGKNLHHAIGLELGFLKELNNDSPYGIPAGIGLFYQFTGPPRFPVLLGVDVNSYGFPPLDDGYETSLMLVPSLSIGYGYQVSLHREASIGIFPVLKYGQYIRRFTYEGKDYQGSRPVLSGGVEFILFSEMKILFSFGFFYTLYLDDQPINFLAYRNRTGYVF